MKTRLLFLFLFMAILSISEAQVSINNEGTDPNESAMLDISSTDKGLLIPRMSSVQRQQIENPANGLMVFDETSNTFWFYSEINNNWEEMGGAIVNYLNDLIDVKSDAKNLYIGFMSGQNNVGLNNNTAVGIKSMSGNTAGNYNTALGYYSLNNSTTGTKNVAIGSHSLFQNVNGNQNTAIGYSTGSSLEENASGNIFIGYEAGKYETGSNKLYIDNSSSSTPLIGGDFDADRVDINGTIRITGGSPGIGKVLTSDANGYAYWVSPQTGASVINDLEDAKTNANSLYIGEFAGEQDENTNYNVGIGQHSLQNNTDGNENAAMGFGSLANNTIGEGNTAVGSGAMASNETGNDNLAIGHTAMAFNHNGSDNTAVGNRALLFNTGDKNTAIGRGAGQNTANTSGNIFIGYEAGIEEEGSNKLYIENSSSSSPLIGGDFETNEVDINGNLSVNGQIKISGGNPGDGKVLTSDENGNASWTEANNGAQTIGQLADAKTYGKTLYMGDEAGDNDNQNTESTGVGYQSLLNNSGLYNNAFGYGSMLSNSEGYDNTAFGRIAMSGNTSGDRNVGFGNGTLNLNKTGNNNTAIGAYAGAGTSDDISGSVFIGQSAGYNETENNKLYIENSSSSTPLIGGDFSTDEVVINGTLQITGGAPGEGKVLVSDADGKASWSDAAGAQNLNQLSDAKTDDESIYIGELSGDAHTIGNDNTSLGYGSMASNSNGFGNTAFGKSALTENTNGFENVAIGKNSLKLNKGGDRNTIIGTYAGSATSEYIGGSVFIGHSAGKNETESNKLYIENSSSSTPLIGGDFSTDEVVINGTLQITGGNPASGKVLVSDSQGKASWSDGEGILGIDDLTDAKHNGSNLYIGNGGNADYGQNKNTAVGHSALNSNNTGEHNVAFGYSSLLGNTSGSDNTALGYSAMEISTNGFKNTAVGSGALYYSDGAGHNTAIGFEAGFGAPGSNSAGNVFIGYKAGYHETGSNKLYISNSDTDYPLVYGDFAQSKLEVNGEFKVVDGAYTNVKMNDQKLESNVAIDAKSSLDVDGEFTANDKIIANDNIEAHEDIILSDEKNITYENARTAKVNYAGSEFFWSTYEEDDYSYDFYHEGTTLALTTQPYSGRMYFRLSKQIQLPEGAKITNIKFSFGGGPDDEVQIQIIKRSFEQTYVEGDELFESTFHFGEGEWTTYEFGFSVDPIIDNDYIYQICLRAQVNDNDDSFGGIFGLNTVSVEYEYETLNH